MAFYGEEYKDLLAAQRVMSQSMQEAEARVSERSQCARALVDIVRLKRDIRAGGNVDPKPMDVSHASRKPRSSSGPTPTDSPTDPSASKPA